MKPKLILKTTLFTSHCFLLLPTAFVMLCIFVLVIMPNQIFPQGVAINPYGNAANNSAGLDIDFSNKGLLIPRLNTTQRDAIGSPAEGLLIFNTSTKCFESYVNAAWNTVSCPSAPAIAGFQSGAMVYPGSVQTFSTGVETQVLFGSKAYDRLSEFNTSTNRFTAQSSGYYFVHASIKMSNPNDQDRFDIAIRKNTGTYVATGVYRASGNNEYICLLTTNIIYLNSGDYLDVAIWSNYSTKNLVAGNGQSWFVVQRMY